jgi:archaellum biogenesis ATPase FlaH
MLNEGGEQYYTSHKKVIESIHYSFQNDINKISEIESSIDNILSSENSNHPLIIKLWMQEEILLETIVIIDSITNFVERENKKITETIIWPDIYRKITKYKPFVKFDDKKCLEILKKSFTKA